MTKSAKLFSLPILCLVLLTLFTPKQALAQTGSIEGDVVGFDGTPLVGVTVTIDRKDIKQHFEIKKTDKKGHYFHAGLPVSYYRVAVVQDGKELYFFDNIKVPLGDTAKLDFNLKQEMERAKTQPREMTAEEKAAKAKQDEESKQHDTMKSRFEKGRELYNRASGRSTTVEGKTVARSESTTTGPTTTTTIDSKTTINVPQPLSAQEKEQLLLQAAEEFKAAALLDPTQHVIFANLAEAYKGARKYDDAIQSYTKALELLTVKPDPATEASYHMNLALVYALGSKMPEALAETEKSTKLNPATGSKAYYNLGATLVNSGKASEAADAFKKATEVDPNNADAQYQLGICLMSRAQTTPEGKVIPAPGTVEAFQKYIDLQPNGNFAAVAKDMIATLSTTLETKFKAEKEKPAPKKK